MEIANWDKWQTFRKDRGTPPWIKVYRNLLSNEQWVELTDSEKGQLVSIWMLAADKNGQIPDSPKMIQRMAMLDSLPSLSKFIDLGFLTPSCQPLDNHKIKPCPQVDAPEKRRVETDESRVDKSKEEKWLPPDWINKPAWIEWENHRSKVKKKEWSDLARTKAANKLKGFSDVEQQEAIDNSIEAGYPGLYPKKLNINGYGNGNNYEANKNNNARPESNLARFSRKIQADIAAEDPFE
jgi:hypothetical protein